MNIYIIFFIFFSAFNYIFTKQKKDFFKQSNEICKKNELFKQICYKNPPLIDLKIKRDYNFYKKLPPEQYENELKLLYKNKFKKELDLENPKTLNEKIQWLKLYDATPLKTMLADKYLVKSYIKEKIGEKFIIPLLGVWDSFNQINFKSLPNKFVLKSNHGSGMVLIVKNKRKLRSKKKRRKMRRIINRWMNINFAYVSLELHYLNIKRKIIAEIFVENSNGDLYDYKAYCFDGRVESIAFLSGKDLKKRRIAFFDTKWNKLNYTDTYPQFEIEIPKPKNLDLIIKICEKLSKGFSFVRIDFYVLNDGSMKFGEFTFTPFSGMIRFNPPIQDRIFGDMLKLPNPSPFPIRK